MIESDSQTAPAGMLLSGRELQVELPLDILMKQNTTPVFSRKLARGRGFRVLILLGPCRPIPNRKSRVRPDRGPSRTGRPPIPQAPSLAGPCSRDCTENCVLPAGSQEVHSISNAWPIAIPRVVAGRVARSGKRHGEVHYLGSRRGSS